MAKRDKMTETELSALLDGQIADAVSYEESELASLRDKALKYREGVMDDLPAETGKSSVVSMDVNDTISWIKPGLMRIFANSDRVVEFEPTGPGDEEYAAQATDYINYLFLKECRGYKVLLSAFDDGLGLGNGIIMHWWDKSESHKVETFTGLSDDAFTLLVSDDDVEVLEHTAYQDPASTYAAAVPALVAGGEAASGIGGVAPNSGGAGPQSQVVLGDGSGTGDAGASYPGEPAPAQLHDVKIKRTVRTGRLRVEAVPPEELLLPRDAKCIDEDMPGIGRERTPTRSQLVKEGFDRAVVDALPAWFDTANDTAKTSRDNLRSWEGNANPDTSMEKVRIYEWWPLVDYDGDGVAERRFVVIGDRTDKTSARKILKNEEWGDDLPFTDLVPNPVAHRRRGRSIFDDTQDIQRVKTTLLRQTLNNLYLVNNPMWEVVHSQIEEGSMDAMVNRELGGNVYVKASNSITPLDTPFVAQQSFPVIEYMDSVKQGRTGVGRQTMGLDPDALQNQTAEAVRDGRAASETQTEFYARNMAEIGFQRFFSCILKLVIKNQDQPKVIRLRNKWVEMDPRPWNAEMDCTVNTGLGAGSRDRDMVMLQQIAGKQEMLLQMFGPDSPLCSLTEYRATLAEMVEVGGLRVAEKYFKEVTPEVIQQWMQAQAQQPNPEMAKVEAQMQAEQARAQADAQLAQQKAAADIETERQSGQLKIQLMREEAAAKLQLAREEAAVKAQLRREEMLLEAELTREANQMNAMVAARQADTNIQRPE